MSGMASNCANADEPQEREREVHRDHAQRNHDDLDLRAHVRTEQADHEHHRIRGADGASGTGSYQRTLPLAFIGVDEQLCCASRMMVDQNGGAPEADVRGAGRNAGAR